MRYLGILFIIALLTFVSISALATNCPGQICVVSDEYTYISTRGYNLETTGTGMIGYGAWKYVKHYYNANNTEYYTWSTTISIKEGEVTFTSSLLKYFGLSNSSGIYISERITVDIPPRTDHIVEKRTASQYTYYRYDLECEFYHEADDTFLYTSHSKGVTGNRKDSWEEHRSYNK